MKTFKKYLSIPFAVMLMTFSMGSLAQTFMAITTMKTNPVTDAQLGNALQTMRGAMEETNTPFYWLPAQSASGENHFMIVVPHDSHSFMDVNWAAAIGEALSPQELEEFVGNLQTSVKSMSTARYVMRPDLGRANPDASDAVPDAVVTISIKVASGKNAQFEAWMANVIAATDATSPDTYWAMLAPMFGTNEYLVIATIDQWENLDTPAKSVRARMLEHFGERRGERMLDDSSSFVLNVENNLYRTRPDLARPPVQ